MDIPQPRQRSGELRKAPATLPATALQEESLELCQCTFGARGRSVCPLPRFGSSQSSSVGAEDVLLFPLDLPGREPIEPSPSRLRQSRCSGHLSPQEEQVTSSCTRTLLILLPVKASNLLRQTVRTRGAWWMLKHLEAAAFSSHLETKQRAKCWSASSFPPAEQPSSRGSHVLMLLQGFAGP